MTPQLLFLCVKIFLSRILDVSIGTVRTILTVKGKVVMATFMGFLEVFIWFMVAREALSSADANIYIALFYAGGYAAGTFVGGKLAKRFIISNLTVSIITSNKNDELVSFLRGSGHGVSVVNVNPSDYAGEKYMLICEIKNTKLNELKKMIYQFDPKAFIIVNETKYVYNGFIK